MFTQSLIVSLHDVSPHTLDASRQILHDLRSAGVEKTSLLVVPDHHHRGHFLADATFCNWLREQQQAGHEIVTHGYFHQRERTNKESPRDKMITRLYTADEGEFYDINETEALEKMHRAQAEFATLDMHPEGFIAPAWLLSAAGECAARQAGFRYTTTLGEIRDFQKGSTHTSQSLVYSVRSAWRRVVSLAWNRSLLSRLRENSVVRFGIHPPDWKYASIRHEILNLVRHLAARRQVETYAEWTAR
ncbi:MAG TPA: polysaccharide deacetylase family protein [Chthoniobacterales bacterium]